MSRRKLAKKSIVPLGTKLGTTSSGGQKLGTKRKDMRFLSPDGVEWDSKFEWQVWEAARVSNVRLSRADKEGGVDTIPYFHQVRGTSCQDCGSARVGKVRGITPDFIVHDWHPIGKENGGYLETKGYMRADKRSLYRSLLKERPNLSLCLIIQSDYRVGKGTFGQWISKILKVPYFHWKGKYPEQHEWILPIEPKKSKSNKKANK